MHRELGNRRFEGMVLGNLGALHREHGQLDETRACLDAGETLPREVRDKLQLAALLWECVLLEATDDRPASAQDALAEVLGVGPDSELGRKLAEARTALNGA